MTFWFLATLLIAAVLIAILWPLMRGPGEAASVDRDVAYYAALRAELERQHAAGEISESECRAALAEQGRHLLAKSRTLRDGEQEKTERIARRKKAALAALLGVPVIAVPLYLGLGAPSMPDLPLAARKISPENFDLATALQKIEAHLAKNPNDGRGFEVVAPVYMRAGRFGDAAHAFRRIVALLGESPTRLADLGESLVAKEDGIVNAEARQAFDRALTLEAGYAKARFYLALAREQDGDVAGALASLQKLAGELPEGPARMRVSAEIERFRAEGKAPSGPADAIAALPEAERREAIRGMVEALDARLGANGGTLEEWSRLVQARIVLGDRYQANLALAKAKRALADDPAALPVLEAFARRIATMTEGK